MCWIPLLPYVHPYIKGFAEWLGLNAVGYSFTADTADEARAKALAFKMILNQLLDIWCSWFDADISNAIQSLREEFQGVELQDSKLNIHAAPVTSSSNVNGNSSSNGKGVKRRYGD